MRNIIRNTYYYIFWAVPFLLISCIRDKVTPDYEGYPEQIGKIVVGQCSVSGCHNPVSSYACAGLDLSSWEALFKGSRANSSVIPYRADLSFLLFSINTFNDLGPKLYPTMPLNKKALSKDEVITIREWINKGAPNDKGEIKFADNINRKKLFVANQGCDLVTVFDTQSKLIMRTINVGNSLQTEAPHDMIISPDGQYIYLSFYAGNLFQKFRTSDNSKVSEVTLSDYSWHSIDISGDSKVGITTHLSGNGKATLIDIENMKIIETYQGSGLLIYPHGCALNYDASMVYITSQQGNYIYKINLSDTHNPDINTIMLQPGTMPASNGVYKPYTIKYFPDYSKYAVTCQGTNELRVFDAANDSLLRIIKTTGVPQLMSFSNRFPYLFVSCMEDSANAQTASRVNVINYNTLQLVSAIFTGYQPRGIAVDDDNNCVWVANRNISPVGWAPHHTTLCNGNNGYITIIDMQSLKLIPEWKAEVSVDPYCIAFRK